MCSADPIILNAIYNTEALNDVFISNFLKDPTLTWQYFGSSTGFFRIYPGQFHLAHQLTSNHPLHCPAKKPLKGLVLFCLSGIKWTPDPNGVVVFDCRNRNW